MEAIFLLASHQLLSESSFLQNTLRLRSDGFVFIYPVLLIFLFLLGWKRSQHTQTEQSGLESMYLSLTIFLNVILTFATNYLIKAFVDRPRPYKALDLSTPTEELALSSIPTDSFPSDHAAVSMTIALSLLFWGYKTRNKGIQTIGRGCLIIALIMGRGRIAIAIHWPTDILTGFLIGGVIAYITSTQSIQIILLPLWRRCINIRISIQGLFVPTKQKNKR